MLIFIPAAAYGGNILANPGFETGLLGPWFQGTNFCGSPCENWNVTSANAHSGVFSATDVGNIEIRQNFAATPTNMVTQVSFWVMHPDLPSLFNAVDFHYSDGTIAEFKTAFTSTTGWEFFDVTGDLAAGKSLTGLSIFGFSASGGTQRTFLDDVTINTVPEPTTVLLVLSGVCLYGLARLRARSF